MKHVTTSVCATAFILAAGAALAAEPPVVQKPGNYAELYVGSGVGGTGTLDGSAAGLGSGKTSFNPQAGYFVSAAVGHSFAYGLALEGEFIYSRNDATTASIDAFFDSPARANVTTYGGLVNVMWAVAQVGPVVPYVGAGVGYGEVRYGVYDIHVSDSGFMWQVKAGVSYPVTTDVSLDLGYRYLTVPVYNTSLTGDIGGQTYTGMVSAHTHLHVVAAGVRMRF
jgi:OOP family OmpA-OmpF porin